MNYPKRYSVVLNPNGDDPMEPDSEGAWVRYDEIKTQIEAENRFREALKRIATSHGASDHSCSRRDIADTVLAAFPSRTEPNRRGERG